ncbi:MAG: HAD family hydrolase [Deltaproteobacteria bacterium]|nr:MAG: HAD family hydrolase [Deltaproteobacteria bacterium]
MPDLMLVDLDGTLVDVDMQRFIPAWLAGIARLLPEDVRADGFASRARQAIRTLLQENDGDWPNSRRFFHAMAEKGGWEAGLLAAVIHRYCRDAMDELAQFVRPVPGARAFLERAIRSGIKLVLATNPVFPLQVIWARMDWGGLADIPFDLVTHWDNCRHCKPCAGYFSDILRQFEVPASRALMVGNDTEHDMAAGRLGIKTFLADTHLVARQVHWPAHARGSLDHLARLLWGDDGIS